MSVQVLPEYAVGLYVGLEGPSWDGARAALYNTFRNKVDYCVEFGLKIAYEDWPMNHLCSSLLCDRGEMISKKAEVILENIGITSLEFTSPYRGDLKGLVEQYFDILNDLVIQYVPGNTVKTKRERGERKPELDGTLTLKELTKLIILEIIEHNRHKVKNVTGDIERTRDGIIETPLNLWNWGMEFGEGCANIIEENDLYLGLLPAENVKIRGDGIYHKGLRYYSDSEFIQQQQSLSRMRNKRIPIKIKYTKSTTNYIWFIHPEDNSINICYLNDTMEKFRNLDLDEYLDQQERGKTSLISTNKKREKGLTKTRSIRNKIIADALKEKKGKGSSKAENIKSNRREEKQHERREDVKRAEKASGLDSDNKAEENSPSVNTEHQQAQAQAQAQAKAKDQDVDAVNIINNLLNKV